MDAFPANSHKVKKDTVPKKETEKPKIEKVVEGEVLRRKKPLGKRIAETFGATDMKSVGGFVLLDVMIPAAKDMVADAISQGIERMLFGEARSTSRRPRKQYSGSNGYVSYNRYSPAHRDDPPFKPSPSRRARASHDFDEIILETRVEAEEVLERLFDLIERYQAATVADLYELVGVQGAYTDRKWGWIDIRGSGITRIRNGYLLDLPRPEALD